LRGRSSGLFRGARISLATDQPTPDRYSDLERYRLRHSPDHESDHEPGPDHEPVSEFDSIAVSESRPNRDTDPDRDPEPHSGRFTYQRV
jgi:hypothetical protein